METLRKISQAVSEVLPSIMFDDKKFKLIWASFRVLEFSLLGLNYRKDMELTYQSTYEQAKLQGLNQSQIEGLLNVLKLKCLGYLEYSNKLN